MIQQQSYRRASRWSPLTRQSWITSTSTTATSSTHAPTSSIWWWWFRFWLRLWLAGFLFVLVISWLCTTHAISLWVTVTTAKWTITFRRCASFCIALGIALKRGARKEWEVCLRLQSDVSIRPWTAGGNISLPLLHRRRSLVLKQWRGVIAYFGDASKTLEEYTWSKLEEIWMDQRFWEVCCYSLSSFLCTQQSSIHT
jgi:hypothetical protein